MYMKVNCLSSCWVMQVQGCKAQRGQFLGPEEQDMGMVTRGGGARVLHALFWSLQAYPPVGHPKPGFLWRAC